MLTNFYRDSESTALFFFFFRLYFSPSFVWWNSYLHPLILSSLSWLFCSVFFSSFKLILFYSILTNPWLGCFLLTMMSHPLPSLTGLQNWHGPGKWVLVDFLHSHLFSFLPSSIPRTSNVSFSVGFKKRVMVQTRLHLETLKYMMECHAEVFFYILSVFLI